MCAGAGTTSIAPRLEAMQCIDGKMVKRVKIVFLGVEINEREIFSKVVESKVKIEDEVLCMKTICSWIDEIKKGKFGTCYDIVDGKLLVDRKMV